MSSTSRYAVVVIGGGQAGLAIGHHLAQQGRRFTILEAADAPAAAWRGRWDSLRLFTPARYDSLPGKPFPGDRDHHPTRDAVVVPHGLRPRPPRRAEQPRARAAPSR